MTSRTFQTIIVIIASITTVSATDIFLPSLPLITTYFAVSADAAQLAIPLYLIGSLIAAPLLGVLADHFGRRSMMLSGLGLFFLGTALCICSPTLPVFLTARFIQGVGAATSQVVGWAIIQDLYRTDESAKIMSWVGSTVSMAPIVAPGVGGYVHIIFGWQGNFVLIALLTVLTLILILFSRPKVKTLSKKKSLSFLKTLKIYGRILADTPFLFYISFYALLNSGAYCYITVAPFYFENSLHLSPDVFGLYLSASAAPYILGTLLTPMILNRLQVNKTLALGIVLTLVGGGCLLCVSFLAPTSPLLIVASFGLYFFGTAMVWAPSTSRALQRFEDIRGAASGLRSFVLMASFALGGFVGSVLDDTSLVPLSLFLLAMTLGCMVIFQKLIKLNLQ